MEIRQVEEQDYPSLIGLYKEFFKVHNIFSKTHEEIKDYLLELIEKNEIYVLIESGVKAAMILVGNGGVEHKLYKFRHFAFDNEENATNLLDYVEDIISNNSETSKVEVTIADGEKGIEMYKNAGFILEGSLSNHYRDGEITFVLGKSFRMS